MINHETLIWAFIVTAIYFFVAGMVAEHSSCNKHRLVSSPLPSLIRGLLWPIVALKFVLLMIWVAL